MEEIIEHLNDIGLYIHIYKNIGQIYEMVIYNLYLKTEFQRRKIKA